LLLTKNQLKSANVALFFIFFLGKQIEESGHNHMIKGHMDIFRFHHVVDGSMHMIIGQFINCSTIITGDSDDITA